jgi:hypothetical protein
VLTLCSSALRVRSFLHLVTSQSSITHNKLLPCFDIAESFCQGSCPVNSRKCRLVQIAEFEGGAAAHVRNVQRKFG